MKSQELRVHIKDRAFDFGVRVVRMVNALPKTPAGYALGNQLVRSGTSIGANIEEAQGAFSKKDFIHSMQISLKEARETLYWIKTIVGAGLIHEKKTLELQKESEEIIKILTTIIKHAKLKVS